MATVTGFDLDNSSPGLDETRSYTEGQSAIRLAPDASVSANGNFSGQTLTISGLLAEDKIGFASGVSIVGNTIWVGKVTIGTFAGGKGGANFVVTFNSNATASRVQTLLRNLTFKDTSDNPAVTHTLSIDLAGTVRTDTVTVTPVNDRPVVDLNGAAPGRDARAAFTEQTPITIAPAARLSDPDSTNLTSLTARLKSRPDGDGVESLSLNAAAAAAAAGLTVTYNQGNGTLTITGAASRATYETILQGIVYNNTSNQPNTSNRTVRVTVNDGEDASVAHDVRISVARANDAPVMDLNGGAPDSSATLAYTPGAPLTKIAPAGTVADVDSSNFNGGSLRVSFTQNGTATDKLAIMTDAVVTLTNGGTTVRVNGTTVGTVSGGNGGTDLVITFTNSNSTPARVQLLLEHIGYANTSGSPSSAHARGHLHAQRRRRHGQWRPEHWQRDRDDHLEYAPGSDRGPDGDGRGGRQLCDHGGRSELHGPGRQCGGRDVHGDQPGERHRPGERGCGDDVHGHAAGGRAGVVCAQRLGDDGGLVRRVGRGRQRGRLGAGGADVQLHGDGGQRGADGGGFANTTTALDENTSTASRIKVADIVVTDDALGSETLTLSGADAAFFELDGSDSTSGRGDARTSRPSLLRGDGRGRRPARSAARPTRSASFTLTSPTSTRRRPRSFANATTRSTENTSTAAGIKVADIVVTDDALGSETLTLSGADAASLRARRQRTLPQAGATLELRERSRPTA